MLPQCKFIILVGCFSHEHDSPSLFMSIYHFFLPSILFNGMKLWRNSFLRNRESSPSRKLSSPSKDTAGLAYMQAKKHLPESFEQFVKNHISAEYRSLREKNTQIELSLEFQENSAFPHYDVSTGSSIPPIDVAIELVKQFLQHFPSYASSFWVVMQELEQRKHEISQQISEQDYGGIVRIHSPSLDVQRSQSMNSSLSKRFERSCSPNHSESFDSSSVCRPHSVQSQHSDLRRKVSFTKPSDSAEQAVNNSIESDSLQSLTLDLAMMIAVVFKILSSFSAFFSIFRVAIILPLLHFRFSSFLPHTAIQISYIFILFHHRLISQ